MHMWKYDVAYLYGRAEALMKIEMDMAFSC